MGAQKLAQHVLAHGWDVIEMQPRAIVDPPLGPLSRGHALLRRALLGRHRQRRALLCCCWRVGSCKRQQAGDLWRGGGGGARLSENARWLAAIRSYTAISISPIDTGGLRDRLGRHSSGVFYRS